MADEKQVKINKFMVESRALFAEIFDNAEMTFGKDWRAKKTEEWSYIQTFLVKIQSKKDSEQEWSETDLKLLVNERDNLIAFIRKEWFSPLTPSVLAAEINMSEQACRTLLLDWKQAIKKNEMEENDKEIRVRNLETLFKEEYIGKLIGMLNMELDRLHQDFINKYIRVDYVKERLRILRKYFLLSEEDSPRIIGFRADVLNTEHGSRRVILRGAIILSRLAKDLNQQKTDASFWGERASVFSGKLMLLSNGFLISMSGSLFDYREIVSEAQANLELLLSKATKELSSLQDESDLAKKEAEDLKKQTTSLQGISEAQKGLLRQQATDLAKARLEVEAERQKVGSIVGEQGEKLQEALQENAEVKEKIQRLEIDVTAERAALTRMADWYEESVRLYVESQESNIERTTKAVNRLYSDLRLDATNLQFYFTDLLYGNQEMRRLVENNSEDNTPYQSVITQLLECLKEQEALIRKAADDIIGVLDQRLDSLRRINAGLVDELNALEQYKTNIEKNLADYRSKMQGKATASDQKMASLSQGVDESSRKIMEALVQCNELQTQLTQMKANAQARNREQSQRLAEMSKHQKNASQILSRAEEGAVTIDRRIDNMQKGLTFLEGTMEQAVKQVDLLFKEVLVTMDFLRPIVEKEIKRLEAITADQGAIRKAGKIRATLNSMANSQQQSDIKPLLEVLGKKRGFGKWFSLFTPEAKALANVKRSVKEKR